MPSRRKLSFAIIVRISISVLLFVVVLMPSRPLFAVGSTNYSIEEDFIGGGGTADSSSASYQSQDSIGATAVGDARSTNNRTQSGATTTNDPMLEFTVSTSSVSLGALSNGATATGTASFSVRNYTSNGYIVQTLGAPPTNGTHTLTAPSSPAASAAGTEQFGINLVANTSPTVLGTDPQQIPDNTFSFGAAASGYNTANSYKYVSGDTIAAATESSGQTNYTISYIANIATGTPAGQYSGRQTLVCTGTY
jgi:hypothetical protein